MARYTITGQTNLPDDLDPLEGTWQIRIGTLSGAAVDLDGSVRFGQSNFATDDDGFATASLPESGPDDAYVATFVTKPASRANLGPYVFQLEGDMAWGEVIEYPVMAPPAPSAVAEVLAARDEVEADRAEVAGAVAAIGTRFTGAVTPAQGQPTGTYVGHMGGGVYGVLISDGANSWALDLAGTTNLRFMKAGVAEVASLSLGGNFTTTGRGQFADGLGVTTKTTAKNRIGISVNQTLNGSNLDGTLLNDKVGHANSLTIKGSFSGEGARGLSNPYFVWGANDFIVTGDQAGDAAGLQDVWGRLSEVHHRAPAAPLNTLVGFQAESNMQATAAGSTVQEIATARFVGPRVNGGTAVKAYTVHISAPTTSGSGSITGPDNYALYVAGKGLFSGLVAMNGGASVFGAFTQESGQAKFTGAITSSAQGIGAGAYIGNISGNRGIALADGTTTVAIDLSGTSLRFMKSNVHEAASLTMDGDLRLRRGFGAFNTGPVTSKPTVSGSRAGNAALASLLTALASYGLVTDSSSA